MLRRHWTQSALGLLAFSALLLVSFQRSQLLGGNIGEDPLGRIGDFLHRMAPVLKSDALLAGRGTAGSLAAWYYDLPVWLKAIRETIEMAIVATLFGALGAVCASFLCARNLMPFASVRFVVRRSLEVIRTMPDLILAIILVAAFGVGPLPGVITLAISTMGGLGKLFAEINEQVDPRQLEALEATGAGPFNKIRYGVLPQVLPNYLSYGLLRLEGNLAGAAALGIVGAGGIGLELQWAITATEFSTYLAILLLMIGVIFLIDLSSEAIRHRLMRLGGPS
jgi:phosphonate transport system permease protein